MVGAVLSIVGFWLIGFITGWMWGYMSLERRYTENYKFLGTRTTQPIEIPLDSKKPELGKRVVQPEYNYWRNKSHITFSLTGRKEKFVVMLPEELRKQDDNTVLEFIITNYTPWVVNAT